ncbi:MAG: hypothetical protein KJ908_09470, partial [Acidobacteria bacterium]|nr:hypothetical protein [Acidobacteriota bacterium]
QMTRKVKPFLRMRICSGDNFPKNDNNYRGKLSQIILSCGIAGPESVHPISSSKNMDFLIRDEVRFYHIVKRSWSWCQWTNI